MKFVQCFFLFFSWFFFIQLVLGLSVESGSSSEIYLVLYYFFCSCPTCVAYQNVSYQATVGAGACVNIFYESFSSCPQPPLRSTEDNRVLLWSSLVCGSASAPLICEACLGIGVDGIYGPKGQCRITQHDLDFHTNIFRLFYFKASLAHRTHMEFQVKVEGVMRPTRVLYLNENL